MKKSNRGQISIYICAMLCVFLILILTVLQGIRIGESQAKSNQAVAAAADSIKGDYQPDLFRRYHILALDRTYYGRGEGYLEERAMEFLEYNLNPEKSMYHFNVKEVLLSDAGGLMDHDLTAFKQQVEEYMKLMLPVKVLEGVFDKAEASDCHVEMEGLSAELNEAESKTEDSGYSIEAFENPTSAGIQLLGLEDTLASQGITDIENVTLDELLKLNLTEQGLLENPQSILREWNKSDILYIIIPEQVGSISKETVSLQNLPSSRKTGNVQEKGTGSRSIENITDITGMLSEGSCSEAVNPFSAATEELYGIAYALDSFQHFGDASGEKAEMEYHALSCEVEYLLEGQASDYDNLTKIAEELSLLRFVPNAVYAFGNDEMKEAALLLAALLLAPVGLEGAAEPVSYVFLACWAYAESLLDVRCLFQGEAVPLLKDKETWRLSLSGIQNLVSENTSSCEESQGMNYEEYLSVLLAVMPEQDWKYDRMLDVMQLNIQQGIPGFRIQNCIYEFRLQAEISEGKNTWCLEGAGSYLP